MQGSPGPKGDSGESGDKGDMVSSFYYNVKENTNY